jgi:hypothetical protein
MGCSVSAESCVVAVPEFGPAVVSCTAAHNPFNVVTVDSRGEHGEADMPAGGVHPHVPTLVEGVLKHQARPVRGGREGPAEKVATPAMNELAWRLGD